MSGDMGQTVTAVRDDEGSDDHYDASHQPRLRLRSGLA